MDGFTAEGSNHDDVRHYQLLSIDDALDADGSANGSGDGSGVVFLPDGENFLRADFTRSGPDLILETPNGNAFIVPDYFMQAKPPALFTAAGAHLSGGLVSSLAGPALPGQVAQVAIQGIDTGTSAQGAANLGAPIGQVSELEGQVSATRADGTQVTLVTGEPIYQGDVIETGTGASVGVVFVDDTIFTLDEDGRMVMDEMVYDPGTQTGSFNAQVVQGVFSFVSGQVAKTSPDAMSIATPTSTIGIRGSTVVIKVVGASGESQVMLVADVDGNVGEISVFNDMGSQVLSQPGASTLVSSFNAAPSQQIVMSQQDFQQTFGKAFTTLTKVVATKAQQDARQATDQAQQKDAEARDAADAAQKAAADADAAKAEAEAQAEAAAQAVAEAEAQGDAEALAAAQAQAAEAEAAAQAAAQAEAAAQAAAQAADAKAAEAQAAQEQAQQALQFQAQAQTVFTQQTQVFETFQQQNPAGSNDGTAGTANEAGTADTKTQNGDGNQDSGNEDGGSNDPGEGDVVITITVDPVTGDLIGEITIVVSDDTLDELNGNTLISTEGNKQNTGDDNKNTQDDPTPTNAAPTVDPVSISGSEDATLTGQITATDPEGGALTYTVTEGKGPANGSVVVNADGSFDYTPTANFVGDDTFTVTVEDNQGATATATVSVTVAAVNDAPVAGTNTASGSEDTTISGQVAATDPEGGTLTYALASAPTNGTVTVNTDGTYTYTPTAEYSGSDSFDVTVTDSQNATTTATVSLSIAAVNDVPTLTMSAQHMAFPKKQDWSTYDIKDIAVTDFDGDTDDDIVFSHWDGTQYKMALATNDGSGSFTVTDLGFLPPGQHFELGDLNNDGSEDIVFAQTGAAVSPVYFNNGNGTFTQTTQQFNMSSAYEIKLADMNGDGLLDIVAANTINGSTPNRILYNNSGGVAGQFADSGQSLANNDTKSVAVGDINNDGKIDAVFGNWNNVFEVQLNDGTGTMTNSQNVTISGATLGIELGDLDGDGDLDAFLANRYVGNLVMLNDGTGTFTDSGQVLGVPSHEHNDVKLADLDGDGDLDAVVSNYNSYDQIWINDGNANFTEAGLNVGAGIGGSVGVGDFNGDGKIDFVLGMISGANSGVYINESTLANESLLQGGNFTFTAQHLTASDVDGDTLTYTVTAIPTTGSLQLNGTALAANDTFTQADVDAGRLTYVHDGAPTTSDAFTFTLSDGTMTLAAKTFNIAVNSSTGDANDNALVNWDANTAFDGGAGTDSLDMGGALSDHKFSAAADGTLTVTDTTTGGDTDTVANIETLTFSDATVTVATQTSQQMVNTTTESVGTDTGLPEHSGITMLDDGGYIVYWTITRATGGDKDMLAQRFDVTGQAVGAEFQINDAAAVNAAEHQDNFATDFASLSNGGFAAVYSSVDQAGVGTGADVVLRLFDSAGTPGSEILVNTTTASGQHYPEVVELSNGDLLVVWQTYETDGAHFDITGQRLDSAGNKLGGEFTVNQTAINTGVNSSRNPDITALNGGGFAVAWDDDGIDGSGNATMLRIFDDNATGGTQIQVNTTTASWQEYPHIAQLENGNIAVTWQGTVSGGSGYDVAVRIFDTAGNAQSNEILVNATTGGDQAGPQIASLTGGGFVVVWHSTQNGNHDVFAQRFAADGTKVGTEFMVNTASSAPQASPSVAGTFDGGFIVTWSDHATLSDGRGDIYSKRFDESGNEIGYTKLTGDASNNVLNIDPSLALVAVDGSTGTDTVNLGGVSGEQNLVKVSNIETLNGGAADDMVAVGNTLADSMTVDLGAGLDTVKLADGGNTNSFTNVEEIIGGTGNDSVTVNTAFAAADEAFYDGQGGTDSLTLTAGNDVFDATGFETIDAGAGTDEWRSKNGIDISGVTSMTGLETITIDSDNNEQIALNVGANTVFSSAITIAGSGDDTVVMGSSGTLDLSNATLSGISAIHGSAGADTITGTSGIDTIVGGDGNDIIVGGGGNDAIIGGAGGDTITLDGASSETVHYTSSTDGATVTNSLGGRDIILGYTQGTDKIGISGTLGAALDDIGAADGSLTWTTGAADFTNTHEAMYVADGVNNFATQMDQSGVVTLLANLMNTAGVTSAAGDDALIAYSANGAGTGYGGGIFHFQENGTTVNNVTADELTYIAKIDSTPLNSTITTDVQIVPDPV